MAPYRGDMSQAPAASGTSAGYETVKDSYVPVFSNRPNDYREWRQRINLYYKKMLLQKRPQEAVINLVTTLSGVAWKQIEPEADKLCEDAEHGFSRVLQILDKTFKYDDRVEQPRAFEKFFYQCNRRPGQTLMSYCSEHREFQREVEKHGIKIPSEITGWLLLRRSGLSQEQRQLVMSQTGSTLAEEKVEEALYYLYGQDYRGKNSNTTGNYNQDRRQGQQRWYRKGQQQQAYTVDEDEYEDYAEETYNADDEDYAYVEQADDYNDYYEYEDDEQAYNAQSPDEEADFPQDLEDPEVEEAYATYLDARRRLAELKTNRNFYPVVALGPDSQGQQAQQPYRPPPRGKGPSSKGKGKRSGPPPQKGDVRTRGKAGYNSMQQQSQPRLCLKCHQPGHFAADCPQKKAPSSSTSPKRAKTSSSSMVNMVQEEHPAMTTADDALSGIFAQQDGGASCLVCGHDVLMNYIQHFNSRGYAVKHFRFRPVLKTLHFGGDRTLQSSWSVHLPVYVHGSYGRIQCYVVEGKTPLLLGRPLLAALKIDISYAEEQMRVDAGDWFPIPLGPHREHLLRLDDAADEKFSELPELDFDFVTTETLDVIDNTFGYGDTYDLRQYIENTKREPPEVIMKIYEAEQESQEEPNDAEDTSDAETEDAEPYLVRRNITNKLLKTLRLHQHMLEQKRRDTVDRVLKAHEDQRLQFWEVYSGEARLATAMQRKGYIVQTFDLHNGWNFCRADHRTAFNRLQYEISPDMLWLAPPCTKWSSLQHLNVKTVADRELLAEERYYEERTHLRFTKNAHNRQYLQRRHSAVEQPWTAESWWTETFRSLEGYDAEIDQCQYGATLPDDNGIETPIKKKTGVRVTNDLLAEMLTRLCPGNHEHLPIEGSSPGIGSRAKAAAAYCHSFCNQVADIIDHFLYHHYVANDTDTEPSVESPALDYSLESNTTNAEIVYAGETGEADDQELPPPPSSGHDDDELVPADELDPGQTGVLQRLQETRPAMAARTVQRLHRNLGHPTNLELHKILTEKKASEALLEATKEHKCELCAMFKPPKQPPKSGMRHSDTFMCDVQTTKATSQEWHEAQRHLQRATAGGHRLDPYPSVQ